MNRFLKVALACFGSNIIFLLLFYAYPYGDAFYSVGFMWMAYIIVQLFTGLILSFMPSQKERGNGIMLGCLLGLLVGFSVCSGLFR